MLYTPSTMLAKKSAVSRVSFRAPAQRVAHVRPMALFGLFGKTSAANFHDLSALDIVSRAGFQAAK